MADPCQFEPFKTDAVAGGGVKPAAFAYAKARSLDDAIRLLGEHRDAKLLAGGHSLLPLMKVRLAVPTVLVDLRKIPGLHGIQQDNGGWRIGPMTRHADLQDTTELGVVSRAASQIADQQVRNRGTIGGSLAHGDPASDLPAVLLDQDPRRLDQVLRLVAVQADRADVF